MKKYLAVTFTALSVLFNCCTNGQTTDVKTSLAPSEFASKIKELPKAPIVDVRTPGEFAKGHLQNARNIDWNGNDFDAQIAGFDKSQPVFVYCLSGGRSAKAAEKMRSDGFKEVYELKGGIMKWRGANLPETTENKNASAGMTRKQFDELINSNKLVLVDFYADWCAPCKKMKPYLDEISIDMSDKVILVRINTDDNQAICRELKIDALPVLQLYKNKILTWSNSGYIEKADVVEQLQ